MSRNTPKDDSTGHTMLVEDKDEDGKGDGDGGSGVADDEDLEVRESVGPGDGPKEDTSDGVV